MIDELLKQQLEEYIFNGPVVEPLKFRVLKRIKEIEDAEMSQQLQSNTKSD